MAYNVFYNANIVTASLTLKAALQDSTGTIHATLRDLACTEVGQGFYYITIAVPDGYVGSVFLYTGTLGVASNFSGVVLLAGGSIQPRELENLDVKVSSLGGMGTGAFPITVTVTDGTDPLQNVIVTIFDGSVLAGRLSTDVNGNATFSLNAGTYTAAAYKGGFQMTPQSRTVTGSQAGTLTNDLVMTSTGSITPPADPDLCTLFGFIILPSGLPGVNVKVEASLVANRPVDTTGGSIIAETTVSTVTESDGSFELNVVRTDVIDPSPTYKITCVPARIQLANVELTTPTQDLADLLPS